MEVKAMVKNKSRIGCSVCKKKVPSDTLVRHDSKRLKNSTTKMKYKECDQNKMTPVIKPKVNECYCNYMEQIKNESFPKILCSKRLKLPSLIDVDEDWLNEIIDFRRENWFDCHSDSFVGSFYIQNDNPFCIFHNYPKNYHCLNDSLLLNHIECNELKTESKCNTDLESPTVYLKHPVVDNKKTTKQKPGKKKNISKIVYKPWIPPSVSF